MDGPDEEKRDGRLPIFPDFACPADGEAAAEGFSASNEIAEGSEEGMEEGTIELTSAGSNDVKEEGCADR